MWGVTCHKKVRVPSVQTNLRPLPVNRITEENLPSEDKDRQA